MPSTWRVPALALLLAVVTGALPADGADGRPARAATAASIGGDALDAGSRRPSSAAPARFADIGDTVPGLFLSLVNDALKGKISPRSIRYSPPSSVILEDAVLSDPRGAPVARVSSARATLSLRALLSREIVISRIDLVEPKLLLEMHDGTLNLLEALSPKKPPDKSKPAQAAFRIDAIRASKGGFRFTDNKNVTVTADDIEGTASLEVDLSRDIVIVDVRDVSVASGAVKIPELDVPLAGVRAAQVRVLKDRLDVMNARGVAAGATITTSGSISLPAPGMLTFSGTVDAPPNAWPERLERLPFETPAFRGTVEVKGPYENPRVAVDATLQAGLAYGYSVDGGRAVVDVTRERVAILEGTHLLAGGGSVRAVGALEIASLDLDLSLRALDLPLARAIQPAKLEPPPRGVVHARAHLRGKADGKSPLRVDGTFGGRRVEITGVKARGDVEGSARLVVRKDQVTLEEVALKGDRFAAHANGEVFLDEERVALLVSASAEDAAELVPQVPEDIRADGATFDGTVYGPYKSVKVEGRARVASGDAWGVPFTAVEARLNASSSSVILRNTTGEVAGGTVRQLDELVVTLGGPTKAQKAIRGTFLVEGADLARVQAADPENADLPLRGRANAEAVLSGPYDDPTVEVRAAAGGLVVAGETIGEATARVTVTKTLLAVRDATVRGPLTHAETNDLLITVPDLRLDGHVQIFDFDLAALEATKNAQLSGRAAGSLTVRGDVRSPDLAANLETADVALGPQRFGSGPVDVSLVPDVASAEGERRPAPRAKAPRDRPPPPDRVARIAARLASDIGLWDVAASYAIERKVLNARARFADVDLAPFTRHLGTTVAPLEGFVSGSLDAWGPLDALSMRARMRVPEVAVAPQRPRGAEEKPTTTAPVPLLRPLGALLIDATMDEGALAARLCAFPAATPAGSDGGGDGGGAEGSEEGGPCTQNERVWANIQGRVDALHGTFDIGISGQLEERALEDLLPAVASRGFSVGGKARADAQIVKEADQPVDIRAQATLLEASVEPAGSIRAHLVSPAELLWADRKLTFETPARFASPSGEVDVVVGGEVGDDDIALDVDGTVSLAIAKLFTEQIANASGTARTKLALRGRYESGIVIEGNVTPSPGAVITPRALGQPVTFQSGLLGFAPLDGELMRVTAVGLQARVGEGDAQLRGSVDVRTARPADEVWVTRWDLFASGSGLSFRLPNGRGEGDLELTLTGDERAPLLQGTVEITDGTYRKSFELRNFVLAEPPGKEPEPMWVTLSPLGLANLELDVQLGVQNFRTRAMVSDFDADLVLRGNLRIGKTLRLPALDGAIEVEEGTIDFPRARFEVLEMQLEFPTGGDGRLNPLVHLTARAEIPPGSAGTNDTEIPIDLFLDGDLESGLKLDLVATDPQREWTRSDLLGLILFGRSLESTVADADTSLALRALMREAAAPLTAELERLAQETLGVAVEIDPTGWRWQLGRRLQLEGAGFLIQDTVTEATTTTGTTTAATTASVDAFRGRLLVWDHLAVGKDLSLEGRTTVAGGLDMRLSWRLFED